MKDGSNVLVLYLTSRVRYKFGATMVGLRGERMGQYSPSLDTCVLLSRGRA